MDSVDLRFFLAVADEGGIGKAARRLNCVQPNVTTRIRLLEEELAAQLFHRNSRGVSLTRSGEALLPYARQVTALMLQARTAVQDSPIPRGGLAIGAMDTTAAVRLPPILIDYHARYPEVELTLMTAPPAKLVEDVLERRVDAAFVAAPVEHPDLLVEPAFEEEVVVVAPPSFAWPQGLRGSPRPLTLLAFHVGCPYRNWIERWLRGVGVSRVRILEFGTVEGILGGVAAGIGVALLPRAVVGASALGARVRAYAPDRKPSVVPTVAVRRRDALLTSALARFLECSQRGQRARKGTEPSGGSTTKVRKANAARAALRVR